MYVFPPLRSTQVCRRWPETTLFQAIQPSSQPAWYPSIHQSQLILEAEEFIQQLNHDGFSTVGIVPNLLLSTMQTFLPYILRARLWPPGNLDLNLPKRSAGQGWAIRRETWPVVYSPAGFFTPRLPGSSRTFYYKCGMHVLLACVWASGRMDGKGRGGGEERCGRTAAQRGYLPRLTYIARHCIQGIQLSWHITISHNHTVTRTIKREVYTGRVASIIT